MQTPNKFIVLRAIEYTIYNVEIKEARSKYEKLTAHREKINVQQNEVETKLIETKMSIQETETQIRRLETHYKGVKEERASILKEQTDYMERKTQLELGIKDLSEEVARERDGRKSVGAVINACNKISLSGIIFEILGTLFNKI